MEWLLDQLESTQDRTKETPIGLSITKASMVLGPILSEEKEGGCSEYRFTAR